MSDKQTETILNAISANTDVKWTFVFMHKPLWKQSEQFEKVEDALSNRPYTVFNGHVHQYSYQERNGRDYIQLGTTGGGREFDGSPMNLDHIMWVSFDGVKPEFLNLTLEGMRDLKGKIPANGDTLCLSSSECQ